ncbi:MAG: ABC transporter permease [Paludibacteraceae bacterium]|nr:ABC transporter permease [Paludibacteraceae bacterium]
MKKINREKIEAVKSNIRHEHRMFRLESNLILKISDTWNVFCEEMRRIFHDPGVIVLFFVAVLLYPLLYNLIYWKNSLTDVPVAVVDMDHSPESRRFIHQWNATSEVEVTHICLNMAEAEYLVKHGKVHGILYIPSDFNNNLASGLKSATLSLFCDMSSLLYMKNVYLGANKVMLDNMYNIQVERYGAMNMDKEFSWEIVQAAPYEENTMFVESGGYGHFLIPCVLVLILHQTLLFGISMLTGTAAQENREVFILPGRRRRYSVLRILLGRGAAYFVLYMALSSYVLLLIPRLFHLPHIGPTGDIIRWMVPFLLATIYFGISISAFMKERETGLIMLMPTSLIFLFLSGVSWPVMAMPDIWGYVSTLIPYTWGVHGFLQMNSMGTTLAHVPGEYYMMWIMAAVYFGVSFLLYTIRSRHYQAKLHKKQIGEYEDYDVRARRELDLIIHDQEQEEIRAMEQNLYNALHNIRHSITRAPDDSYEQ